MELSLTDTRPSGSAPDVKNARYVCHPQRPPCLASRLGRADVGYSSLQVRCNRVLPRCDRCITHDAECVYPERAKRRPQRPPPEHPTYVVRGGETVSDPLSSALPMIVKLIVT